MKYLAMTILALSVTACVQEGPPYDNVRNQRAQESLRDTDHGDGYYDNAGVWHSNTHVDGYYDRYGVWHGTTTAATTRENGYYDANGVWHDEYEHGHDHVARHDD